MSPVADTIPHPTTERKDGYKPGCYDRPPFSIGYWFKDSVNGSTWIEHRMTTECQIAKTPLAECAGCIHVKSAQ